MHRPHAKVSVAVKGILQKTIKGIVIHMFAVIFKAEINELDAEYTEVAERMRNLAINEYGCTEFTALTEGDTEIAISYWEDDDQIRKWKQNAEHLSAQAKGKSKWYKSYTVQVVEVLREYRSNA